METRENTSYHTRAFAQVTGLTLFLLGCLYKALGYLSGMCFKAFVRVACQVSILYVVLTNLPNSIMQVTERHAAMGFTPIKDHSRKHALYPGCSRTTERSTSLGKP